MSVCINEIGGICCNHLDLCLCSEMEFGVWSVCVNVLECVSVLECVCVCVCVCVSVIELVGVTVCVFEAFCV